MGSYGIGPGRTLSAIVEQNNDDKGMILPVNVAPYAVCIVLTDMNDQKQIDYAYDLEKKLEKAGIDVLVDDRDERAGVKFNDMDLIGIPIRVTLGKNFDKGLVEIKLRREDKSNDVKVEDALKEIKTIFKEESK